MSTTTPAQLPGTIRLELCSSRFSYAFDCWNAKGEFIMHTSNRQSIFTRRARYMRVNQTGKVYRIVSRQQTEEIPAALITFYSLAGEPLR